MKKYWHCSDIIPYLQHSIVPFDNGAFITNLMVVLASNYSFFFKHLKQYARDLENNRAEGEFHLLILWRLLFRNLFFIKMNAC